MKGTIRKDRKGSPPTNDYGGWEGITSYPIPTIRVEVGRDHPLPTIKVGWEGITPYQLLGRGGKGSPTTY